MDLIWVSGPISGQCWPFLNPQVLTDIGGINGSTVVGKNNLNHEVLCGFVWW
jgi:hypothetical protein